MANDRTFRIRPVLEGQTLAAGLRRLVPELSWADARQLIIGRRIQINGNLTLDETRRLKGGDVVKLFEHARAPVPTERDVRVLHVDADLIVIDKPAGITTLRHAEEKGWDDQRKQRQPTLDELLQRMLPGLAARFSSPAEAGRPGDREKRRQGPKARHPLDRGAARGSPGRFDRKPVPASAGQSTPVLARNATVRAVHRLDRDTSGLMVFALSQRAETALVSMFKAHDVKRAYWAVALGRVDAGRIESHIARDRGDGLRGSTRAGPADQEAKLAITHVKPVEHLGDGYTILDCRLETGRTHQIRIHLSEAGHMLCGEKVYTRPFVDAPLVRDPSGAPRHALHSAELEFSHPIGGQLMKFTSPVPKELALWLARLRR